MPLMILIKETKEFKFYGSLKPLLINDYPDLNVNKVNESLSRLKVPYEDENYIIYKGELKRSTFKKSTAKK